MTQDLTERLERALQRMLGAPVTVEGLRALSGGASQETWAFDTVPRGSGPGPAAEYVLRRTPAEGRGRFALAATMDAEAALLGQAARAGVPVPEVIGVLEPADALGEGFVMARVSGETLPRKILRDPAYARARGGLAHQCGQALARIHAIPVAELPPLRRAMAAEELAQYREEHVRCGAARPVFELAFRWLGRGCPTQDVAPALVHGDFRHGNLIVDTSGLRAVIDWELAHLGDPMQDLGWICVNSWRFGHPLPVGGFGTREALYAGYEAAGGKVDRERARYWEILGTLRWGVMCEMMAAAWIEGHERNVEKAAIGRRASEVELDLLALLVPAPSSHVPASVG